MQILKLGGFFWILGISVHWTIYDKIFYNETSVRQRRRPLNGYSPPAAYVRQRRRLQYGYGSTVTYVRMRIWYISHAVSE